MIGSAVSYRTDAEAEALAAAIESADSVDSLGELARMLGEHRARGIANGTFPPMIVAHAARACGLDAAPFLAIYETASRPFLSPEDA